MKIHGTAKGGALSKKDFGVAFSSGGGNGLSCPETMTWSSYGTGAWTISNPRITYSRTGGGWVGLFGYTPSNGNGLLPSDEPAICNAIMPFSDVSGDNVIGLTWFDPSDTPSSGEPRGDSSLDIEKTIAYGWYLKGNTSRAEVWSNGVDSGTDTSWSDTDAFAVYMTEDNIKFYK